MANVGDDLLDDEQKIMDEQANDTLTLSSKTFELPIHNLPLSTPVCVKENTPLSEVIALMQKEKIGSVVVVSDQQKLVGIFTERDVLFKVMGKMSNWEKSPVSLVMTKSPLALQVNDMIAYVMNNMHVGGYRHVPIVDENRRPVGIISIKDVMSFILDHFPEHITNITGEPFRGSSEAESA